MAQSQVVNENELLLYIWVNSNSGTISLNSDTYSDFPWLAKVEEREKKISQKFCWYTELSNQGDCLL